MRYYQAKDTFQAELDGIHMGAVKGETLPEGHVLVKHDLANGGKLFSPLPGGEPSSVPAKDRAAPKGKALWRRLRRGTGCGSISRR